MRVFVTGSTGLIGSALVKTFAQAGHDVFGLVRSSRAEESLGASGGTPVMGDLADPSDYQVAAECDVLIHAAFDFTAPVEIDRAAVQVLTNAGARSEAPVAFLYTSGCWVLGDTGDEPADEGRAIVDPAQNVTWRVDAECEVLDASSERLSTAVIRPGYVYGGPGGLFGRFFESARSAGSAGYVGDGTNRWSVVHRDDLAKLYLMIASDRATGVFHGVDGQPSTVADLAAAASRAAGGGGSTHSIPPEEARFELGPVADAMCLDQSISCPRASQLGWQPIRTSFIESADDAYSEWLAASS